MAIPVSMCVVGYYIAVTVSDTEVTLSNEVVPTFLICAVDGEITTPNKSPPGLLAT